jgi:hypothetical protein
MKNKSSNKYKRGGEGTDISSHRRDILPVQSTTPTKHIKQADIKPKEVFKSIIDFKKAELENISIDNFSNKIPLIYKLKLFQIFKNYKYTNKGVILGDSDEKKNNKSGGRNNIITTSCHYKKRGGASLDNYTSPNIYRELLNYCTLNLHCEIDINNFINGRPNSISRYSDLSYFIYTNKEEKEYSHIIPIDPTYSYSNCIEDGSYNIPKGYSCYDYNKNIITAYESNFYTERNKRAIDNFIKQQQEYLRTLPIKSKRIIQDYTNQTSFAYYCNYLTEISGTPVENADWRVIKNFGDAFYTQIHKLHPDILNITNYNAWLATDRKPETADFVLHNFTNDQWNKILEDFMKDLNDIIIEAPPVEEEIYCYRGVSDHYIKNGVGSDIITIENENYNMRPFKSSRLSSFSLDFNASKEFYNICGNKPNKCLYRITILPHCRVLYVAPLSVYKYEIEILAPSNSTFYYNFDKSTDDDLKTSMCYNNIEKKYGICSKNDNSFNSFDSVLALTPQPEQKDIDKCKEIVSKTFSNFSTSFLTTSGSILSITQDTIGHLGSATATATTAATAAVTAAIITQQAELTAATTGHVATELFALFECCSGE